MGVVFTQPFPTNFQLSRVLGENIYESMVNKKIWSVIILFLFVCFCLFVFCLFVCFLWVVA